MSLAPRAWTLVTLALLSGFQLGRHGLRPGVRSLLLFALTAVAAAALARTTGATSVQAPPRRSRSAGTLLAFRLGSVVLGWLALEAAFAAGVRWAPAVFRRAGLRRPGDGVPAPERLRAFFTDRFDAELGWDRPGHGPRPGPRPFATAQVSAFGDSFTECVGPEEETWETHLGARLGTNVLDLGVAAYGPDQALLKMRRELSCRPTRVVLLGILSENVCRAHNVFRLAYSSLRYRMALLPDGTLPWEPTKPRFVMRDGRLVLVPNPVRTERDLFALAADPARFLRPVAHLDHFSAGFDPESVFPTVSFPYTLTVPRGLATRARLSGPRDPETELLRNPGAVALLAGIAETFAEEAGQAGAYGLTVLFGLPDDYRYQLDTGASLRLGPLERALERKGLPYVDTVEEMARATGAMAPVPAVELLYDSSSHLTPYGNRIVADVLARHLAPYLDGEGSRGAR